MRHRRPRRIRLAASLTVCALALGSCSSLPRNSEPSALRPFEPIQNAQEQLGPTPDQEPDLLLREFYAASARPAQAFQVARSYLASGVAERWQPEKEMLVVDRVDINTQAGASNEERTFDVRGSVIARLDTGGAYRPENGNYEASVTMRRQEDGQWRITGLPNGVVFERSELRSNFQPKKLFFFDPSGEVLVGDRRWVYEGERALDSALINLLMQGPTDRLAPGVRFGLPPEATFLGNEDGVYKFSGLASMSPEQRIDFSAQLVWTLAEADIPGPYRFEADGTPLAEGYTSLSTDDFAALNPELGTSSVSPLYALADGRLLKVSASGAQRVEGELGQFGDVSAADISDELAAVVRRQADHQELWTGSSELPWSAQLRGKTLTRPSVENQASAVWSVVDGRKVVRLLRAASGSGATVTDVAADFLQPIDRDISVLRLSQTGVHVAMIIDGRVYIGVVAVATNGQRSIVGVHEIAAQLGGTAVALDWQADGSLLVGTSTPASPLWRVEQDGSQLSELPSGNVTAPVVAVASGSTTMYLTDAIAIRHLPASATGESAFWWEVPGLQGVRSVPIIAH